MNTSLATILATEYGDTRLGPAITRALNLLANPTPGSSVTDDVNTIYANLTDLLDDLATLVNALDNTEAVADATGYTNPGPTFTSLARDAEVVADAARWKNVVRS
jgi:hypothetical protein